MNAITVLGSCSIDHVVRQQRLPRPGETVFGVHFETLPGGKGLNQALASARAGGDVRFLGAVGPDEHGTSVRACLGESGVDVSGLQIVDSPTGTAHIAVLEDGENAIVFVGGANGVVLALDESSRRIVENSDFLVTQFERPLPLVFDALATARAAGVRTVLTPAPVVSAEPELLALVDILVPNATEARELARTKDEEEAAIVLSRTCATVILTRGEHGAIVAQGGEITARVPARRVTAFDTTAAGDTFVGALVAWLANGASLEDSLRAGSTAASIAVTRPGASMSIPWRDEIEAALHEVTVDLL